MPHSASYFISRVTKGGRLDSDGVIKALREAPSVEARLYAWTVLDVIESELLYKKKRYQYLAGRLVKYNPDASVEVVDESARKTRLREEPNLQLAASTFVYFPSEAIFGHKRIWNLVSARDFRSRVAELVEAYHERFFVDCQLEPVADIKRFLAKLAEFDSVMEIRATVSPPNPLFGPFWKDLKEYLKERRARQLLLHEKAAKGESLVTTAPEAARRLEAGQTKEQQPAPLADAAVLMAADGYGNASVTGRQGLNVVVVRTSQNALQLKLSADASPAELAAVVVREIVRVNRERGLRH